MKAIDIIVNASPEELVKEFKTLKQGDLLSFKNNFIIMYESQKLIKDALIEKVKNDELSCEEADEVLKPMYIYMQKLEDVVTVINEVLQSRK